MREGMKAQIWKQRASPQWDDLSKHTTGHYFSYAPIKGPGSLIPWWGSSVFKWSKEELNLCCSLQSYLISLNFSFLIRKFEDEVDWNAHTQKHPQRPNIYQALNKG